MIVGASHMRIALVLFDGRSGENSGGWGGAGARDGLAVTVLTQNQPTYPPYLYFLRAACGIARPLQGGALGGSLPSPHNLCYVL